MATPIGGYPTIVGDHKVDVIGHQGPVLYAAFTTNPVAGGDTVYAAGTGLHSFDAVIPIGFSDSGLYYVIGVAPAGNPTTDRNGAAATSWKLKWFVTSTGVEAGAIDLSAETVRLFVIGRY